MIVRDFAAPADAPPKWWADTSEAARKFLANFGAAPPADFCSARCAEDYAQRMAW